MRRTSLLAAAAVVICAAVSGLSPGEAAFAAGSATSSTRATPAVAAVVAGGNPADWETGQWWIRPVKLPERHAAGLTGKGVNIATLDGPIVLGIPELKGQRVIPAWTACTPEWNASDGPLGPEVSVLDRNSFHTTSMAALMVGNGRGTGPGGAGILGVAPEATLRVYTTYNTTDPDKTLHDLCNVDKQDDAIDRAVADGANIILIPKGFAEDDDTRLAVNRAVTKGVIIVNAAGNGGAQSGVTAPGTMNGVLVIGAMDRDGKVAPLSPTSNGGGVEAATGPFAAGHIHAVAPGMQIIGGTVVGGRWESNALQNGTSASAALVAGQLALMRQKWPTATSNQLLYSLLRNTNRDPNGPAWTPRGGYGTTSFEKTLTIDPTQYPDVHPFYDDLGNVMNDHPTPPRFMPTERGPDRKMPTWPPRTSTSSATSSTPPATPSTSGTSTPPVSAGSQRPGQAGANPLPWVGTGVVLLGALAGGVFLVLRNRRRTSTI